jgi:hypothetical protein
LTFPAPFVILGAQRFFFVGCGKTGFVLEVTRGGKKEGETTKCVWGGDLDLEVAHKANPWRGVDPFPIGV